MTIRKQTLIQGWGDLAWLAMVLAGLAALFVGAWVRELVPAISFLGAGAGFLGATAVRYLARERWLDGIHGYTAQGTCVWADPEIPRTVVVNVEAEIAGALSFWTRKYPDRSTAMTSAFDGAIAAVIYADALTVKFVGKAHGASGSGWMAIAWPAGRQWVDVGSVARHEAAHVCLFAAGVPQEKHHEVMAAAGFR